MSHSDTIVYKIDLSEKKRNVLQNICHLPVIYDTASIRALFGGHHFYIDRDITGNVNLSFVFIYINY